MKLFDKGIWFVVIILVVTTLSVGILLYNSRNGNYAFNADLNELHEHSINLKIDNNAFLLELHDLTFHSDENHILIYDLEHDHLDHLLEYLDLILLRFSIIEDLTRSIDMDQKLLDLHPPLIKKLKSIKSVIQSTPLDDIPASIPEIESMFEEYEQESLELIRDMDQVINASVERSMEQHRRSEFRVIIASTTLVLAVSVLLLLLLRYRSSRRELRLNEEKLNVVLDSMEALVLSIDKDFFITTMNKKAKENLSNGTPGVDLFEVFPNLPLDREELSSSIAEDVIIQKEYKADPAKYSMNELHVYPLSGDVKSGAVLVITDRSEQSRMKDLIAHNEKMLSVGGLAAGMAHEINNPLAGMIQTAAVIRSRLTDKNLKGNIRAAEECGIDMNSMNDYLNKRDIIKLFDGMSESGEQASTIVGNMLDFVQRENSAISTHDIKQLVDRSLELASTDYDMKSYLYFDKIAIIREFEENLPLIPCSGSRIQQVILNILRNGAEAMVVPREGPPEDSHFIIRLKSTDRAIRLEIEDNGPGMDEEVRKRIFEPFYTTKGIGEGTGLGLSVAYFIISEYHHGFFEVKSSPGAGTTFIIELPLAE